MRFLMFFILFGSFACTTRSTVSNEYAESIKENFNGHKNKKTTILFLVDGLSKDILIQEIRAGHLPEIKKHFLISDPAKNVHQAYAAFPSLTYTNIANLLSEKPIHLSRASGNKIFLHEDDYLNFESVFDRSEFSKNIAGQTIFSRLRLKNQTSISLDYGLGTDATAFATNQDFDIGLALGFKNHSFLDQKKLTALENILNDNPRSEWPSFIFIHLVGIDMLSHKYGKHSREVYKYLSQLDHKLAGVFKILRSSESVRHPVVSILTADHGFASDSRSYVPIEKVIHNYDSKAVILNEGRMVGVYSNENLDLLKKELLSHPKIDLIAAKEKNRVTVQSQKMRVTFDLIENSNCHPSSKALKLDEKNSICPEKLNDQTLQLFYPQFLLNLIYYFQTENSPNLVIVSKPLVSFSTTERGAHGGPTPAEIFVPVLLRNATFPEQNTPMPLWQLLNFL